jgi:thioesterase domain-containing protein
LAKLGLYKMQPADDNIPDYMNRLVEKLQHAVSGYNETPYNGRIFLFKAKRRIYFVDEPQYLGWKNYATKGVVVNEVEGDHKDMLLLPNVKQFAKILQRVLDEVAGCYLFLLLLNYMADSF